MLRVSQGSLLLALVAAVSVCTASADWSLRFDGAGPLRIGMSLSEVSTALGETLHASSDPDEQSCFYVEQKAQPQVALMMVDGRLARIDLQDSSLRTASGIAIGDPVARVKSTYGDSLASEPHMYADGEQYLTAFASDKRYAIRFETRNGKVGAIYGGVYEQVEYVEGCL